MLIRIVKLFAKIAYVTINWTFIPLFAFVFRLTYKGTPMDFIGELLSDPEVTSMLVDVGAAHAIPTWQQAMAKAVAPPAVSMADMASQVGAQLPAPHESAESQADAVEGLKAIESHLNQLYRGVPIEGFTAHEDPVTRVTAISIHTTEGSIGLASPILMISFTGQDDAQIQHVVMDHVGERA
jgi:hypothetical protein